MKLTLTIPAYSVKSLLHYSIITEKNVKPGPTEEGLEYKTVTIKYEEEDCTGPHDTAFYKVRGYAGRELWLAVPPRDRYDQVDCLDGICERVCKYNTLA